jgi:hypothetical protein
VSHSNERSAAGTEITLGSQDSFVLPPDASQEPQALLPPGTCTQVVKLYAPVPHLNWPLPAPLLLVAGVAAPVPLALLLRGCGACACWALASTGIRPARLSCGLRTTRAAHGGMSPGSYAAGF